MLIWIAKKYFIKFFLAFTLCRYVWISLSKKNHSIKGILYGEGTKSFPWFSFVAFVFSVFLLL